MSTETAMNPTEVGPGLDSDSHIHGKEREIAAHSGIRVGKKKKGLTTSELCINLFIIHLSIHIIRLLCTARLWPSSFLFLGHLSGFNKAPTIKELRLDSTVCSAHRAHKNCCAQEGDDTVEDSRKGTHIPALWNSNRCPFRRSLCNKMESICWKLLCEAGLWTAPDFYTR